MGKAGSGKTSTLCSLCTIRMLFVFISHSEAIPNYYEETLGLQVLGCYWPVQVSSYMERYNVS